MPNWWTISLALTLYPVGLMRRKFLQRQHDVQFLLIDGVGHDRKELQKYSTEFFKKFLDNQ